MISHNMPVGKIKDLSGKFISVTTLATKIIVQSFDIIKQGLNNLKMIHLNVPF